MRAPYVSTRSTQAAKFEKLPVVISSTSRAFRVGFAKEHVAPSAEWIAQRQQRYKTHLHRILRVCKKAQRGNDILMKYTIPHLLIGPACITTSQALSSLSLKQYAMFLHSDVLAIREADLRTCARTRQAERLCRVCPCSFDVSPQAAMRFFFSIRVVNLSSHVKAQRPDSFWIFLLFLFSVIVPLIALGIITGKLEFGECK